MRKLVVAVGLLSLPLSVAAQWNTNGSHINNSNTGNVGIGTSSPTHKLHVLSSGASATPTSSALVVASATTGTDPFGAVQMSNDPNYGAGYFGARGRDNSGALAAILTGDVLTGLYGKGYTGTGWSNSMAAIRFVATQDFSTGLGTQMEFSTTSNGSTSRNTRMIINHAGNIGIGTTAPADALNIYRETQAAIGLTSNTDRAKLGFRVNTSGKDGYIAYKTDGRLSFHMDDANGAGVDTNEFLSLLPSGNLGVGTTMPAAKLEVNGDANIGSNNSSTSGYGARLNLLGASSNGDPLWLARYNVDVNISELRLNIGDDNGEDLFVVGNHYWNGNVWRAHVAVKSNGNLGIGTTTPQSKLEVVGNSELNGGVDIFGTVNLNDGRLSLNNSLADSNSAVFVNSSSTGYGFYSQGGGSGRYSFHFLNQAGTSVLYGKSDGNVGIGTTNPDAKLAVKGRVHAEEVKVDLTVPGPDYVFEPAYELPTLAELELYIKANKHLPEVPSAKEMEANGINLSEMNMLLLKKVEELTLHVIELKKVNEKQDEVIQSLLNKK